MLARCLGSIRSTTDGTVHEIVVVAHEETGENESLRAVIQRYGAVAVPFEGAFNFSLMNNAGAAWGAPAEDHPLDAWNKVINLNLTAVFLVSQAVARLSMIPRKYGRIINLASIAGLVGTDPRMRPTIAYNASKGGVVNFTRSLAVEWAHYGITVNAIAPGVFPSKMSQGMIDKAEHIILEITPMKRLGTDYDLKGLAVLLASDASAYITGQIVAVDGGLVAM
jgi:gluconate 5-dehydrogenase